jgi:hypothetical protein
MFSASAFTNASFFSYEYLSTEVNLTFLMGPVMPCKLTRLEFLLSIIITFCSLIISVKFIGGMTQICSDMRSDWDKNCMRLCAI